MRIRLGRRRAICVFTVLLASLSQQAAFGQKLTSLSGTVSDPSGAVVPNAALTVTNGETGFTQSTVSDSAGRYGYPQMPSGKYKLSAKAPGFAEEVMSNVELRVGTATTVNVTFSKVGATSETISVVADAVQVNTSDATIGNAISSQAIVELPSFARNVASLLQFQPGVTTNGQVNGGKSDQRT
jgi:hypothetical protein